MGYLKGQYKSESSLMTCVAELHGSVTRMPSSILSDMGNDKYDKKGGKLVNWVGFPDGLDLELASVTGTVSSE